MARREESPFESRRVDRKARVPLGVPRRKLSSDLRPGYVRRWINDAVGRLEEAQAGGYQFVQSAIVGDVPGDVTEQAGIGLQVSRIVGKDETGGPITAFLMEIPQEFYDEDQAEKNDVICKMENSLRRGADNHGAPGKDGRYVPKDGIKIERGGSA